MVRNISKEKDVHPTSARPTASLPLFLPGLMPRSPSANVLPATSLTTMTIHCMLESEASVA